MQAYQSPTDVLPLSKTTIHIPFGTYILRFGVKNRLLIPASMTKNGDIESRGETLSLSQDKFYPAPKILVGNAPDQAEIPLMHECHAFVMALLQFYNRYDAR